MISTQYSDRNDTIISDTDVGLDGISAGAVIDSAVYYQNVEGAKGFFASN